MNFLKSWWYRRQRKLDIKFLWQACFSLAKADIDQARTTFLEHALRDRAWLFLGKDEIYRIIDDLAEEARRMLEGHKAILGFLNEIEFEHHRIRIVYGERRVVVTLWDGAVVFACPQDTPEYLACAQEVGAGNVDTQCIQHDVAHAIFGEMLGGESPVLAHVARGTEFPQEQLDSEEAIVKLLQKYFNKYQWPSDVCISATNLQEVMSGARFTDHSKV